MNWFQYLCTCKMHKFEVIFKRTKTQYKRKKRLALWGIVYRPIKLKICNCCNQNAWLLSRAKLFKAGLRYPRVSVRFEFRFESLKSISVLILFVYRLTIGSSKNNRGNYPRKCFWTQERETRFKFSPGLSASRLSNNWAVELRSVSLSWLWVAVLLEKQTAL